MHQNTPTASRIPASPAYKPRHRSPYARVAPTVAPAAPRASFGQKLTDAELAQVIRANHDAIVTALASAIVSRELTRRAPGRPEAVCIEPDETEGDACACCRGPADRQVVAFPDNWSRGSRHESLKFCLDCAARIGEAARRKP